MAFRRKSPPDAAQVPKAGQGNAEIGGFADTILLLSRFLSRLSTSAPFVNAKLGLAEWMALNKFAEVTQSTNRQIAKSLNITGQRAKQICDALGADGLIAMTPSATDARQKDISITVAGRERLATLNTELLALLNAAPDAERTLTTMGRTIRRKLLPIVAEPVTPKAA